MPLSVPPHAQAHVSTTPDRPPIAKARSLVDGYARQCLEDLGRADAAPRPEAAVVADGCWTVLVAVLPTPAELSVPGLTECDRDCLLLLAQAPEPPSAARIRRDLEKRGLAVWSEITVQRSLARLHKQHGLIANSCRAPRGDSLPENLPIVRNLPICQDGQGHLPPRPFRLAR
jgi:hypothetical protein